MFWYYPTSSVSLPTKNSEAGRQECLPHPHTGYLSMTVLAQESCTHCLGNSTVEVLLLPLFRQKDREAGRQECLPHPQTCYRVHGLSTNKNGHSNVKVKWPLSGQQKWILWSGKRDSNPRLQAWEACALPAELFPPLFLVKSTNSLRGCQEF